MAESKQKWLKTDKLGRKFDKIWRKLLKHLDAFLGGLLGAFSMHCDTWRRFILKTTDVCRYDSSVTTFYHINYCQPEEPCKKQFREEFMCRSSSQLIPGENAAIDLELYY